jgi:hypothetical protein
MTTRRLGRLLGLVLALAALAGGVLLADESLISAEFGWDWGGWDWARTTIPEVGG